MDFSNADLQNLAIHYVGSESQPLQLADEPVQLDVDLKEKLEQWMLLPFVNASERMECWHPESLQFNEVHNYVTGLFNDNADFIEVSRRLAGHLHRSSRHPKIKPGELYVAHLNNIAVGNRLLQAVGIFKSENKAGFFRVGNDNGCYAIDYAEGVPVNKVEKGCLIVNNDQLDVFVIDNQNKGEEARYWTEDFLQVRPAADNYHYTKNFLTVAKQFITEHLSDRENINRIDQVKMLDESVKYFKENEQFDIGAFNQKVFSDPQLIDSFQEYGTTYLQHNNVRLADSFEINNSAVKKQARIFKSVLKLDRNFHIYIHGNRDLIEQGYDEVTGKRFYKLYFDEES